MTVGQPYDAAAEGARAGSPGPPAGQVSDADLLRRHAGGDQEAFGTLFLRHRDRLWAVAVRTLGDPDEAADALQEAMISAFRRAGGFRGECAVTTWLHRIVVNACLDRLRRRAARPATHGMTEEALDALAIARSGRGPAHDSDTRLDVMAALRELPAEQCAALVLVDMLGYPVADAAAILGTAPGTVKSRCARGRARLLPRLAHLRGRATVVDAGTGHTPPVAAGPPTGNQSVGQGVSPAEGGGDDQQ